MTATALFTFETHDEVRVLHALTSWALDRDVDLIGLTVDRPSLEDVYLELTSTEVTRVNTVALSVHQLGYEQKSYWRNPASAGFTFAFPVIFLVLFGSLNTGSTIDFLGGLKLEPVLHRRHPVLRRDQRVVHEPRDDACRSVATRVC